MTGLMAGKRGLIMGLANDRSLAWGIAKQLGDQGAELAFTYLGESLERRVRPLAESVGARLLIQADVTDDASMDKAFEELTAHDPERSARLVEAHGRDAVVQGCREIMLWHLDRGWARHLETMNDVRESIHLRALGRENPLDEFHRIAIDHFRDLASHAVRKSETTFAEIEFTASGVDLEANSMARPTSTWTYMVHDNPMAAGGNVFSGMMSTFR